MENVEELPTAQGTDTGDGLQATEQQANEQQVKVDSTRQAQPDLSGVQRRIDELVAKVHDRDRRIEQLVMQNNELLARVALSGVPVQKGDEEEMDDLTPEDRKRLERALSKALRPYEERLNRLDSYLHQQEQMAVAREVDQRLAKLNNPAVSAKVEELMRMWASSPNPAYRHATKRDAYLIALGMLHDEGLEKVTAARDEQGRFKSNAQQHVVAGVATAKSRTQPSSPAILEKDVSEMSPDELAKFIEEVEKQNPNGLLLR